MLLIFSFIISIGGYWHNRHTLFPLSQSNTIFSENDIKIVPNLVSPEKIVYDNIQPSLRNVGKASAKELKFQVYAVPFDDQISWDDKNTKVKRFFSTRILNTLEPESVTSFGNFNIYHVVENTLGNKRDLSLESQQIATCILSSL